MTADDQAKPLVPKSSCTHETSEYRIKFDTLQRPLISLQCKICGKRVSDVVSPKKFSKEEIDLMLPWDGKLQTTFKKAKSEQQKFQHEVQRDLKKELKRDTYIRLHSERQSAYSNYLKSEEWQNLRRKVLARANGRCEGCGDKPATDVHHLTYERFGKEMLFDLVAVCKECHKKIHKQSKATTETNCAMGETLFRTTESALCDDE